MTTATFKPTISFNDIEWTYDVNPFYLITGRIKTKDKYFSTIIQHVTINTLDGTYAFYGTDLRRSVRRQYNPANYRTKKNVETLLKDVMHDWNVYENIAINDEDSHNQHRKAIKEYLKEKTTETND